MWVSVEWVCRMSVDEFHTQFLKSQYHPNREFVQKERIFGEIPYWKISCVLQKFIVTLKHEHRSTKMSPFTLQDGR